MKWGTFLDAQTAVCRKSYGVFQREGEWNVFKQKCATIKKQLSNQEAPDYARLLGPSPFYPIEREPCGRQQIGCPERADTFIFKRTRLGRASRSAAHGRQRNLPSPRSAGRFVLGRKIKSYFRQQKGGHMVRVCANCLEARGAANVRQTRNVHQRMLQRKLNGL
jgi:hypothetical protein